MKKQALFIHGAGEGAYEADKKLAASLQHALGPAYEVHYPAMPDEEHAPYEQWKHHIEKELVTLQGPIVPIGHSVGASILMKCMSEIEVKKPISGIFLIANPAGHALANRRTWSQTSAVVRRIRQTGPRPGCYAERCLPRSGERRGSPATRTWGPPAWAPCPRRPNTSSQRARRVCSCTRSMLRRCDPFTGPLPI